jgi:hypothetical protein
MDRQHLARIRLATTLLTADGPPPSATAVVDHLGAVQAQEFALARWSVGQRSGADDATVSALLDAGELIRTHVLRPTWHFVRPADLHWLQELTGPRVQVSLRSSMRKLGLDDSLRDRFCTALADALAGGRALTRDQVAQVAADTGIAVHRMALGHLLVHAELENVICSGPAAVPAGGGVAGGRHHTYALVSDRVPATGPVSRSDALAELTLRYFRGHGPATEKDFAWWSSLTLADVRAALADVGPALERADVEGRAYWGPPGWTSRDAPAAGAHLVQTFDEFVVGYGHSRDALDVAGIASMIGPEWGRDGHPVIVDGQVVGHWRRSVDGAGPAATVVPRRPLTGAERDEVDRAAAAFAAFAAPTRTAPAGAAPAPSERVRRP